MRPLPLLPLFLATAATLATAQPAALGIYPFPKAVFARSASFPLDGARIVVPEETSVEAGRALAWLRTQIERRTGLSIASVTASQYDRGPAIVFAQLGASSSLDALIRASMPPGESLPREGGYVIDVRDSLVVVGAADTEGLFSAISSLVALIDEGRRVRGAHVWDHPDFPARWVFNMANLRVASTVGVLRTMLDTMSALKLNAIQQNDFKYAILQTQPQSYHDSARAYRAASEERGIGIVPGVAGIGYSEGLLWNDPNLAEGFPATSRYVIEADTGRIIPDPRVSLPNGSFESVDVNGRFTGWSYYDESTLSVDRTIVHGGSVSARGSNFNGGNSRFIRNVPCRPNSAYVLTAWLRTEDLEGGELRLLAIGHDGAGRSRTLAYTMFGIPSTSNGWRRAHAAFNTLEFEQMYLYVGLWGGSKGTFWVDDFEIREHGLANVLRRDGTPLHVRSASGSREYAEGIDFERVVDPLMTTGNYPPHQAPTFRRTPGGALRNGDTVDISFFHPMTTYSNEDGYGGTMVCVSEDTLYSILRDQIARVDALYDPSTFAMGHDEIRSMNRDSACLRRALSPAELLADNVRRCVAIIDSTHPEARVMVWSDMFDSLHNAINDYYLVNGDLRGIWDMIPTSLTIGNWNGGRMRRSLDFFASRDFRQIASPYYDERDTRNIRAWRLELETTPGADGMMYTTWAGDYDYLRPFAYYAWGAGPNMSHTPLDSTVLLRPSIDSVRIDAVVWPDPYDRDDRVTSVIATLDVGGRSEQVELLTSGGTTGGTATYTGYARTIGRDGFRYHVTARNAQGLERTTPEYVVARSASSGISVDARLALGLAIRPNPMTDGGAVDFTAPSAGAWSVTIVDALGREVWRVEGSAAAAERVSTPIASGMLARGTYRCLVRAGGLRDDIGLVVVRATN